MEGLIQAITLLLGLVAGVGGLVKLFLEIRADTRSDPSLGALLARPRFRLILAISLGGLGLFGILLWRTTTRTPRDLVLQLWRVELDAKNALLASHHFTDLSGGIIPEARLQEIGRWVAGQLVPDSTGPTQDLHVDLLVPPDLAHDTLEIAVTPPGHDELNLWTVEGGKERVPLSKQALATLNQDFWLEIGRPGYPSTTVKVAQGQKLERHLVVKPTPFGISIGVEHIEGETNSIAEQLAGLLSANPSFTIKGPDALKQLKQEIAADSVENAKHPERQVGVRKTLGVNVIVAGRYQAP